MKKNAYWVLSRDKATTELRFSKCFYVKGDAKTYLPYFKKTHCVWEQVVITLEVLPVGEMPTMRLRAIEVSGKDRVESV
jgi:hypothetical protein